MVKVRYLSGRVGMAGIRRIVVTVTAIPTVYIHCQSVAYHSKERNPGISRNAHRRWQQHTVVGSTARNKS